MKNLNDALQRSKSYLASVDALSSIERDPYWPKWDTPWWHMLLLHEMDLTREIPEVAISKMVEVLKYHYLPVFPTRPEDLPEGVDPYRKIACLCAVGSMYQVLFSYGVDVDRELPWMRSWFLKYQLHDGGLNCDEKAYTRSNPKGSIVSTLPCLEAVLFSRSRALSSEEVAFLDKGASYLLKQRLYRRISSGEVIDPNWLEIRFPRFYEYDFLRGFYFLTKWRQESGFSIPDELVDEVEELVSRQMTDEGVAVPTIQLRRYNLFDDRSYNPAVGASATHGAWTWGKASEFDLMKAVSFDGSLCPPLTKKWNEVRPKMAVVVDSYATVYKNPIKLKTGEPVRIEKRETNPEWLGWVYCTDHRGIAGWVSEKHLRESGDTAVVVKDYDATELDASAGERLKIYHEEFGWCWCRNKDGLKGWIPAKNLNPAS